MIVYDYNTKRYDFSHYLIFIVNKYRFSNTNINNTNINKKYYIRLNFIFHVSLRKKISFTRNKISRHFKTITKKKMLRYKYFKKKKKEQEKFPSVKKLNYSKHIRYKFSFFFSNRSRQFGNSAKQRETAR